MAARGSAPASPSRGCSSSTPSCSSRCALCWPTGRSSPRLQAPALGKPVLGFGDEEDTTVLLALAAVWAEVLTPLWGVVSASMDAPEMNTLASVILLEVPHIWRLEMIPCEVRTPRPACPADGASSALPARACSVREGDDEAARRASGSSLRHAHLAVQPAHSMGGGADPSRGQRCVPHPSPRTVGARALAPATAHPPSPPPPRPAPRPPHLLGASLSHLHLRRDWQTGGAPSRS